MDGVLEVKKNLLEFLFNQRIYVSGLFAPIFLAASKKTRKTLKKN